MGNLKDLQIEKSYSSEGQNLLKDFYVPVLKCAKKYDRISGFFSPKILSVASRGFAQAIKNDVKIRLITSIKVDQSLAELSADDIQNALQLNIAQWNIDEIQNELERDYLKVFSYLLSSGMLEMKIAILNNDGILHQKVGIITDSDNNSISFSGSNNETVYGWETNDEEFKVFTNWNIASIDYFDSDRKKFEKIWNGNYAHAKIIDLPEAIRSEIIDYTKTEEDVDKIIERIKKQEEEGASNPTTNKRELRPYQLEAINHWFSNGFNSIFAMATGTGKTFTTMNALKRFREAIGSLNAVIAVPLRTLAEQWENEVIDFFPDLTIINTTDGADWRDKVEVIEHEFQRNGATKDFIIITTYSTFPNIAKSGIGDDILLVADEMHNLATDIGLNAAASELFKYKIGLSATPERLWKPSESAVLNQLFGNNRFEFGIEQALNNNCLVHFNYHPNFIELTMDEYEDYVRLSRKIAKLAASSSDVDDNYDAGNNSALNSELIKRARIKKNAESKIPYVIQQLRTLKSQSKLNRALIYVDNENFLDDLQNALASSRIVTSRYLGSTPSDERNKIIKNLCSDTIDAIIAIKCLDEGVDIPSARQAFILSNGTDPREYVQRLGRVLRKDDKSGKTISEVHDYLVLPPTNIRYADDFERKTIRNMVKNEIKRSDFFVSLANNRDEAKDLIAEKAFSLGFDFTDDFNSERKEI